MDSLDISSMKVADLKRELKSRGLPASGNKTELVERLQLAVMGAEENLLKDDEDEDAALLDDTATTPVAPAAPAPAKKVAIKRNNDVKAAEPTPAPEVEQKENDAPPPAKKIAVEVDKDTPTAAVLAEATEPATPISPTAVKTMTDEERAKARAAKFGLSTATESVKKATRAERFGLPVSSKDSPAAKGANKLGEAPKADLETLKKRAERFGSATSNALTKAEAAARLEKRKARFGDALDAKTVTKKTPITSPAAPVSKEMEEKLKKRAERFGVVA